MSEQKLDLILSELKNMNNYMMTMDNRMTSMEKRMTSMEERMTVMEKHMTSMDNRITNIEAEQQRHGEHIQQLIQIVGTTNASLSNFEQVSKKHFNQVNRNLRLLESDFELLFQKSNEHERDINRLKHAE
ncbi:hypothetical protein [Bacillus ndiopicus]|uniref:hypothetical protein n=1 Tax=Bacillus ndiopicus TaxID=1347368 RepID=UPI000693B436|nr:hypothetical protein [Bacillus ndiopicus]